MQSVNTSLRYFWDWVNRGGRGHLEGALMFIGGPIRPLSTLEDLELRRERLGELITLKLVSPTLSGQIRKAILQLDQEIASIKTQKLQARLAA
jgi:hypothetical protein